MSTPLQFYKTTPYNSETKEQIWGTIFTDAHDSICGCTEPTGHLLNNLIPPDHPSRHTTIDTYIKHCFKRQLCLFGGKEEKSGGEAAAGPSTDLDTKTTREEEPFEEVNVEDLIAAATAAEKR